MRIKLIIVIVILLVTSAAAAIILTSEDDVLAPATGFEDTETSQTQITDNVTIKTDTVAENLTKPWGIDFLPDGSFFITERAGAISIIRQGEKTELLIPADLDARGEGGLLGVAVDPDFAGNNLVYVCYNTTSDVRVVRWELRDDILSDQTVIVDDMPTASSGRHSGCRPTFGPDGYLWIGTGDAAIGTTPQDPQNLGGKILRVNRDGDPASGNLDAPFDPRIYSYGHRNTQGIAFAQNASFIGINAEHGPDVNDEINPLEIGNFGWDPIPGYNESVSMTDTDKYPDAIESLWSSGRTTVALSGATFVYGDQWGQYDGNLFAATLKAKRVLQFSVDDSGILTPEAELFNNEFGRIRSIEQAPDGNLYMTTDNGGGNDAIIRVTPQ